MLTVKIVAYSKLNFTAEEKNQLKLFTKHSLVLKQGQKYEPHSITLTIWL